MTNTDARADLRFDAPGPGSWTLDPVHFPRPVTRYWAETHPAAFNAGTADFSRFYGMLIAGLETSYVNGFAYSQMRPAPESEIPEHFARAEHVMRDKLWREQLSEWEQKRKPDSIAEHRSIQAVDPDALTDDELIAYLIRCRDHHAAMMAQHMRFTASAIVPTGDFVLHVAEWTGRPPVELLSLTRGSAPVSAGSSEEQERLVRALQDDPSALELLGSDGDPAEVLAALRSRDGESGKAVAGYLDLVGYRPLDGFDISEPSAIELPDALLRAIRASLGERPEDGGMEERAASVRDSVPDQHRGEFDELLAESRLTYRLRDERGIYSDIWASGLMRRAALGAGRRLAERGLVHDVAHVVDASLDEMCSLVGKSEGPTADELAARAHYRATHSAKDAPPVLGPPPPAPPDPSGLPPVVARLMHAVGFAMGSIFGSGEMQHEVDSLRGLGASQGVYEGPARLISGPAEFDRIMQGDVLVTQATSEAFNILLPLLGAIVTDHGGLLSHSAIVAREYGIPGVVGTRDATDRISDGARVRVDGTAGEVRLLG
ncbi:MAG TPA: PEP-utilizing enzyme [Acidimicrobiales bacterium]|nr:PEP-utilizing enzyme [Acidimicrobiales bacterium]